MTTTFSDVLGAIDSALAVVKQVTEIPGVDLIPYVSVVKSAVSAIQLAEQAGKDLAPYVSALAGTFADDGEIPTPEEIAALDAKIAELRGELQSPLPAAEPGEPE